VTAEKWDVFLTKGLDVGYLLQRFNKRNSCSIGGRGVVACGRCDRHRSGSRGKNSSGLCKERKNDKGTMTAATRGDIIHKIYSFWALKLEGGGPSVCVAITRINWGSGGLRIKQLTHTHIPGEKQTEWTIEPTLKSSKPGGGKRYPEKSYQERSDGDDALMGGAEVSQLLQRRGWGITDPHKHFPPTA